MRFPDSHRSSSSIVVGIYLLRPTIDRLLFAETQPRAIEARGNLAEFEKLTIDIFERAAPSVVQVAGRAAAAGPEMLAEQDNGGGAQGGTGFVWDRAGHIVTNNHVVQGAADLASAFRHRRSRARAARRRLRQLRSRGHSRDRRARPAAADGGRLVRRPEGRAGGVRDRQSVRARSVADQRESSARSAAACRPAAGARSPTSSRPTPRSIRATRAGRCSTPPGG